ncbi:hypothetical protein HO133_008647 [Letharia lupina]|uniref:Uncharacterized protein n=1 Tax=Letharia lupina TaxID=560253 RepID=A0A8H6CP15_9LECA|nr:uncharacterized protein HO133_008647 [Letharia lupina]KAF6227205.1 hypothetical protein HO133_008647 [Letharia lupina]
MSYRVPISQVFHSPKDVKMPATRTPSYTMSSLTSLVDVKQPAAFSPRFTTRYYHPEDPDDCGDGIPRGKSGLGTQDRVFKKEGTVFALARVPILQTYIQGSMQTTNGMFQYQRRADEERHHFRELTINSGGTLHPHVFDDEI